MKEPFEGRNTVELFRKIKLGITDPIPKYYSDELRVLLSYLLKVDPNQRPNVNNILKHPLLKEVVPKLLSTKTFHDEFAHSVLPGGNIFT